MLNNLDIIGFYLLDLIPKSVIIDGISGYKHNKAIKPKPTNLITSPKNPWGIKHLYRFLCLTLNPIN